MSSCNTIIREDDRPLVLPIHFVRPNGETAPLGATWLSPRLQAGHAVETLADFFAAFVIFALVAAAPNFFRRYWAEPGVGAGGGDYVAKAAAAAEDPGEERPQERQGEEEENQEPTVSIMEVNKDAEENSKEDAKHNTSKNLKKGLIKL